MNRPRTTYLQTKITFIHTYIHTYIHTCIHTYEQTADNLATNKNVEFLFYEDFPHVSDRQVIFVCVYVHVYVCAYVFTWGIYACVWQTSNIRMCICACILRMYLYEDFPHVSDRQVIFVCSIYLCGLKCVINIILSLFLSISVCMYACMYFFYFQHISHRQVTKLSIVYMYVHVYVKLFAFELAAKFSRQGENPVQPRLCNA